VDGAARDLGCGRGGQRGDDGESGRCEGHGGSL
jgi:hypothetical protein